MQVRNSLEGWAAGRSIPGSSENVNKPFLRQYYHRCVLGICPTTAKTSDYNV